MLQGTISSLCHVVLPGMTSLQDSCYVVQVRPAYLVLDAFHHGQVESHLSVTKIMDDSEYLRECQDLFELYVSDYIMLTRCKVKTNSNDLSANSQRQLYTSRPAGISICVCCVQILPVYTNTVWYARYWQQHLSLPASNTKWFSCKTVSTV